MRKCPKFTQAQHRQRPYSLSLPPPPGGARCFDRRCVLCQVENREHKAAMDRERAEAKQREDEDMRWRQQEAQRRQEQQLAEQQRQLELHLEKLRQDAELAR